MSLTPSNMLSLGTKAPHFSLKDTISDDELSLEDLKGENGTVVMFICNHCPFVKYVNGQIVELANGYQAKGFSFIAISSNDIDTYPEDSPLKMKEYGKLLHYPFPYLFDESQEVAKQYQAACTPDFYLFDNNLLLAYRGQIDGSRPGNNVPQTSEDLKLALDQILENKSVFTDQKPSIGCNIKWKN